MIYYAKHTCNRHGIYVYLSNVYIFVIQRIREYGINTVRIKVQGIGPGRMVCI